MIAAIVAAIFIAIIVNGIKNRKSGKGSCSCGSCGGCAMNGTCHGSNSEQ